MSFSATLVETQKSVDELKNLIGKFYQDMMQRIEALEGSPRELSTIISRPHRQEDDNTSLLTITSPSKRPLSLRPSFTTNDIDTAGRTFIEDLQRSWVYQRINGLNASRFSLLSTEALSTSWSFLTG